jgi:hypothetical protein
MTATTSPSKAQVTEEVYCCDRCDEEHEDQGDLTKVRDTFTGLGGWANVCGSCLDRLNDDPDEECAAR